MPPRPRPPVTQPTLPEALAETHLPSNLQMPSLQHAIATKVVPRLRRNPPVDDLVALREALITRNRTAQEGPPDSVGHGHEVQIGNGHGFPVFTVAKPGGPSGILDSPRRS